MKESLFRGLLFKVGASIRQFLHPEYKLKSGFYKGCRKKNTRSTQCPHVAGPPSRLDHAQPQRPPDNRWKKDFRWHRFRSCRTDFVLWSVRSFGSLSNERNKFPNKHIEFRSNWPLLPAQFQMTCPAKPEECIRNKLAGHFPSRVHIVHHR
ncbi:hypothetical protein HNY73_022877 [Argiope bruennichi]|uniref:Uncharacterized protein n=1 Tax=Argiope bruennichi TaxID=94029 RepID=A0A8T0E3Q0_ARGBR|nr:hypothetical protein HNY73_022877 [Argiope bruennichi]